MPSWIKRAEREKAVLSKVIEKVNEFLKGIILKKKGAC